MIMINFLCGDEERRAGWGSRVNLGPGKQGRGARPEKLIGIHLGCLRPAAQDHLTDNVRRFLARGLQAVLPFSSKLIIFARPALEDPGVAAHEVGLFHAMQQRVKAAGADGVAQAAQIPTQPAAVDRPQIRLVQDDEFHHPLPEGLRNLFLEIHISNIDIYLLGNHYGRIDFWLNSHYF